METEGNEKKGKKKQQQEQQQQRENAPPFGVLCHSQIAGSSMMNNNNNSSIGSTQPNGCHFCCCCCSSKQEEDRKRNAEAAALADKMAMNANAIDADDDVVFPPAAKKRMLLMNSTPGKQQQQQNIVVSLEQIVDSLQLYQNAATNGGNASEEGEQHPNARSNKSTEDGGEEEEALDYDNGNGNGAGVHWDWECAKLLGSNLVRYKEDAQSVEFHPYYAYGTAAVRANLRLTKNTRAFWEVLVNEVYGTSMMFGIGTKRVPLSTPFIFDNLLGGTHQKQNGNAGLQRESYGLSHKGVFFYGGTSTHNIDDDDDPGCRQFCAPLPVGIPCRVGLVFDGPGRRLGFALDGHWLGWAQHGLELEEREDNVLRRMRRMEQQQQKANDGNKNNGIPNREGAEEEGEGEVGGGGGGVFYPMVSSTAQRSKFTVLQAAYRQKFSAKSLQVCCEDTILAALMLRAIEIEEKGNTTNNNNNNIVCDAQMPSAKQDQCRTCCCFCCNNNNTQIASLPLPMALHARLCTKFAHVRRRMHQRWRQRVEAATNNKSSNGTSNSNTDGGGDRAAASTAASAASCCPLAAFPSTSTSALWRQSATAPIASSRKRKGTPHRFGWKLCAVGGRNGDGPCC